MNRSSADAMGMLAAVMNCLAMQDALQRAGQPATVLSAIPVEQVCGAFSRRASNKLAVRCAVRCAASSGTAAAFRPRKVMVVLPMTISVASMLSRKRPSLTRPGMLDTPGSNSGSTPMIAMP